MGVAVRVGRGGRGVAEVSTENAQGLRVCPKPAAMHQRAIVVRRRRKKSEVKKIQCDEKKA